MGFLLIVVFAFLSGMVCSRLFFCQTWIFLVNLLFSVYIALFSAPYVFQLLPSFGKELDIYALPGVMLLIAFLLMLLFYRLTDALIPKFLDEFPMPVIVERLGTILTAACSGAVLISFLCMAFCMMPVSEIVGIDRSPFFIASKGTLRFSVNSLNRLSCQSETPQAKKIFEDVFLIYRSNPPEESEKDGAEKKTDGKAAGEQSKNTSSAPSVAPAVEEMVSDSKPVPSSGTPAAPKNIYETIDRHKEKKKSGSVNNIKQNMAERNSL